MSQSPATTTTALIVAAGRGVRAGAGIPKQYRTLAGAPVIAHTLGAFDGHPAVGEIVIVHHVDDADLLTPVLADLKTPIRTIEGGATRDASVRAGLAICGGNLVLIHDAARPLVSRVVIDGVLDALVSHDGAAPAIAVTDALWRGRDTVTGTAARDDLWRAQTPQGFHLGGIRTAHDFHPGGAADDVEVARAGGLRVAITQGDEANLKLTRPEDFTRAEALLAAGKGPQMIDVRTGNGFDVHRFGPGDHAMLCGVAVPHDHGLQGHSDADVGLHALTDAIYGAMAMGDIGTHFPPSDPQWQGAESHVFLTDAVEMAAREGFAITHTDVTLICENPRIGPHADAMRARMAELLRIDATCVSVKATTTERLGFPGREEGIAALATATLVRP